MKTVILISGKKNAGKDYVAKEIVKRLKTKYVDVFHFADPIKDIIAKTLDVTREDIELMKNQGNWEHDICIDWRVPDDEYHDGYEDKQKYIDMRTILQRFGTDAMKAIFGDDVWVNLMIKEIEESDDNVIVIPDWRFPNEFYMLADTICDVITVRVESPNQDNNQKHSSENSLEDVDIDHVIFNDGESLGFVKDVEEMLKEENL